MRPHRLEITAFGAFAQTQVIDFDRLAQEGLFLIHGRTGAGKTTLLDSIVFALFGEVGGRGTDRLASHHVEVGTRPEVSLEFSVAHRRYRVTRSPAYEAPKRGGGLTTKAAAATLMRLDPAGEVALGAKTTEVTEEIVHLLGLSAAQFSQVMLLPQGKFEAVLKAKSDERQRLLDTLFDTKLYASVTRWLEDRAREASASADVARQGLEVLMVRAEAAWAKVLTQVPELRLEEPPQAGPDRAWLISVRDQLDRATTAADAATDRAAAASRQAAAELSEATLAVDRWDEVAHARAERVQLEVRREEIDALSNRLGRFDAANEIAEPLRDAHRASVAVASAFDAAEAARVALLDAISSASLPTSPLPTTWLGNHSTDELLPAVQTHEGESADSEVPGDSDGRAVLDVAAAGVATVAEALAHNRAALDRRIEVSEVLARATESLREANESHTQATADSAAAAQELERVEAERAALHEQRSIASKTAHELDARRSDLAAAQGRRNAAQQVEALNVQLGEATARARAAIDAHQEGRDVLQTLRQRYLDGIAAVLAEALVDGQPCSVCGSSEHPAAARPTADAVSGDDVDDAEATLARLESLRSEAEANEQTIRNSIAQHQGLAGASTTVQSAHEDCKRLEALVEAAEDALDTTDRLTAALERLDTTTLQLRRQQSDAATRRAGAEQRIVDATSQQQSATQTLAALGDDWGEPSHALGVIGDLDHRAAALRDALSVAGAALVEAERAEQAAADAVAGSSFTDRSEPIAILTEYRQRGSNRDEWYATITKHHSDLGRIDELLARPYVATLPEQRPSLGDTQRLAQAANERHLATAQRATQQRSALDDIASIAVAYDEQAGAYETLRGHSEVLTHVSVRFAGKKNPKVSLQRWVLRTYLEEICRYANQRLTTMTAGRYHLEVRVTPTSGNAQAGLDLDVFDTHTSQRRDVATLSGGETFQASLALALGVADTVSAHHGGIRLDALFVDEGFGSLDPESLQLAMDELDRLREGGRMVGLISHVGALRERIGYGIEVVSGTTGSTARLGTVGAV